MPDTRVTISCPFCQHSIDASLKKPRMSFLLFACPKCHHNVVCYEDKISLISDKMVSKVMELYKLGTCGIIEAAKLSDSERCVRNSNINEDDILNLKIALATSRDSTDFLAKI